jgi:hypothetical protein
MYLGYDLLSTILVSTVTRTPFFSLSFPTQVVYSWTKAFRAYTCFEATYYLLASLAVSLHISKPQDWPPITGSFLHDAWSIRNMWGKCWHQCARRHCGEAGILVKKACGFRNGGFRSRYSQIWVGFAVSAYGHHVGAIIGGFEDRGFWQAVFFMVQPAGIMVEDFAKWMGKALGVRDSGKFAALLP